MGVKGMWPLVKPHLHFALVFQLHHMGVKTLFIDGGVLMHLGIRKAPWDARPGSELTTFVHVCLENLRVSREYGFNPFVVFDGAPPGSKEDTNARRNAKRAEKKAMYEESVRKTMPPTPNPLH